MPQIPFAIRCSRRSGRSGRAGHCAKTVIESAGALTFDEFIADGLRHDATLRNLEIMGEAAKPVAGGVRERFQRVLPR